MSSQSLTVLSRSLPSPIGVLHLYATPHALRAVLWAHDDPQQIPGLERSEQGTNDILDATVAQLNEYFAGTRREFNIPLEAVGTEFQLQVWNVLRSIPYGQTMSYGAQAAALGDSKKARAVGAANGRNPLSIVVPCHRVIAGNGSLTGYGGGIDVKKFLLDLEKRHLPARLPIRRASDDSRLVEMFAKGLTGANGDPLNIFGVLANHPDMLKRWLVFATHVLSKNTLTPRDRELLILRTGWNCKSRYEWGQHVLIAKQCGISDQEIEAVKFGTMAKKWSVKDCLLMDAADELHSDFALCERTWTALQEMYSNEQILDLIATVGNYHLVAMFLNSTRVPLDAGVPDEPELA